MLPKEPLFIKKMSTYFNESAILMYSGAFSSTFPMHILSRWAGATSLERKGGGGV